MPESHEFLFALQLSDEPHFESMLADLASALLAHIGYRDAAVDELRGVLRKALASGSSNGARDCTVRFHAHAGELQIAVVFAGGAEWRTTRTLP